MLLSDSWLSGEQMIPIKGFFKVESHAARQLPTGAVATLTLHNGWHLKQRLLLRYRLLVAPTPDEKVLGVLHSFIFGQQKSIRLLPERLQHNGDPSWRWRYSSQMLACCVCHNAKNSLHQDIRHIFFIQDKCCNLMLCLHPIEPLFRFLKHPNVFSSWV